MIWVRDFKWQCEKEKKVEKNLANLSCPYRRVDDLRSQPSSSRLVKALQAINGTARHSAFLGLWIAVLLLVQRERDPGEGPIPRLDTYLFVLLCITTLVVANLIGEEEGKLFEEAEHSPANQRMEKQALGVRHGESVISLQLLGDYENLLTHPQSVIWGANQAAAKANLFVLGHSGYLEHKNVLEDCPGDLNKWYGHISKGAWPFSTTNHGWLISDYTVEGLKAVVLLSKIAPETVGTGGNPLLGEQAIEESRNAIVDALKESDLVFITAGMGGGTGYGAAPVVAQAFEAIERQQKNIDTLIVIPNGRLLDIADKQMPLQHPFCLVGNVLGQGVQGISDIIIIPGLVNVDFADAKVVMKDSSIAMPGVGVSSGKNRTEETLEQATLAPLIGSSI
ncbi:hypothetical protein JHK87_050376 [Glycine soja]|nr:hypothetical protein JHK87_050376 [Glycine soja]